MGNSHGKKSPAEVVQEHHDRSSSPQVEELDHKDHDKSITSTSGASTVVAMAEDHRIVSLLEFFKQLYDRNKVVFKRIVPLHRETFEEIFSKMGTMEANKRKEKRLVVQRSSSFGDVDSLRLERFKVKPIESGGPPPPSDTKGGTSGTKGGGGPSKPGTK